MWGTFSRFCFSKAFPETPNARNTVRLQNGNFDDPVPRDDDTALGKNTPGSNLLRIWGRGSLYETPRARLGGEFAKRGITSFQDSFILHTNTEIR